MTENELAEKYIPLTHKIARNYLVTGIDYEELHGAAMLGLATAIKKFDSSKRIKFITYAYPCIINEIRTMLNKVYKNDALTDALIRIDSPCMEDSTLTVGELIPDEGKSVEDLIIDLDYRDRLHKALIKLPGNRGSVLYEYITHDQERKVLAKQFGISQERVRQILLTSPERLRKIMRLKQANGTWY